MKKRNYSEIETRQENQKQSRNYQVLLICRNQNGVIKMKLPKINLPKIKLSKFKLPKIRLLKIKWPLRLLLYTATLIFSVLSLAVVYFDSANNALAGVIYALAACMLGLSGCYLYSDLVYGVNEKLKPGIESNPFTNRLVKDYRYRTVLFTYSSLAGNLIFAFSNGIFGMMNHSVWFGTLSAYYIVLSIMRFLAIQYERRISMIERTQKMMQLELSVYRNCGVLFILLTIALGVSVTQMVYYNKGSSYPGILIFVVAAYTFNKIVVAIINIIKAGRLKSPLLMTIRDIGYADALVSVLSLQTAMFVSFGSDSTLSRQMMNSMTGGGVCLMILIMGIYMICSAQIQKKKIR